MREDDFADDSEDSDEEWPVSPWMPPDDRLWRHPTELAGARAGSPPQGVSLPGRIAPPDEPRRRRGLGTVVLAGAVGASITVGGFALTGILRRPSPARSSDAAASVPVGDQASQPDTTPPAAGQQTPSPASVSSGASRTSALTGPADVVERSVAEVDVVTTTGTRHGSALAFGPAGLYVTASRLVSGTPERVVVHTTSSHERTTAIPATVVGVDAATGIAVIRAVQPDTGGDVPAVDAANHPQPGEKMTLVDASDFPGSGTVELDATFLRPSINMTAPDGAAVLGAGELESVSAAPSLGSVVVSSVGTVTGIVTYCDTNRSSGSAPIGSLPQESLVTPISMAFDAAQQIASNGHADHGWLGVGVEQNLDPDGSPHGVVVRQISASSAASVGGLKVGDVIVSVEGEPITSVLDLEADVTLRAPGTPVVITIDRHDSLLPIMTTLGIAPDPVPTEP